MTKRTWAVGRFCAVLPTTNRLRCGNGVLTRCLVQELAHHPRQAQFLSSAETRTRIRRRPALASSCGAAPVGASCSIV
jgi:hypothetical protein